MTSEEFLKHERLLEAVKHTILCQIDTHMHRNEECECLYSDYAELVIAFVECGGEWEGMEDHVAECRDRLTEEGEEEHNNHYQKENS
jgi:hypothetical protein